MATPARWSYAKVQAWAVIGGTTVDIVGVQVDFELNSIPRATIRIPLGRSTKTDAISPIHKLVGSLVEQTPVQVFARFTGVAKSDDGVRALNIPDGPFRIFDGLSAGGGYVRNNAGVAQYLLTCNHWLVQLGQASAFSDSSHPSNPSSYSYGALMRSGADTGGLDWTVLTQASKFATPSLLAADVWGKSLLPWFRSLAAKDGFWINEQPLANLKGDATNSQAKAALDRMGAGGKCYVPLKLRTTLSIDVDVATEVSNDIALLTNDPEFVAHQTLWDILVGKFAPDYLMAVVPRVDDALVVPYVPCNRGKDGKAFEKILAGEYVGIQLDAGSRRPLRAYGILSSLATRSGADGFPDDGPPDSKMGAGGWYDAKKGGSVIIGQGPRWMGAILSPSRYSDASSGGSLKPAGSATFPGAGAAGAAREGGAKRAVSTIKPLLNAYAQARYAQEILQGRYGVVSGPFRVDIAPGSLVEVEGAAEQFIADLDSFGQPIFGEVLRCSLLIDAEASAAGTAFHIGYVRTGAENASDNTSVAAHPLYESTFQGCTLLGG